MPDRTAHVDHLYREFREAGYHGWQKVLAGADVELMFEEIIRLRAIVNAPDPSNFFDASELEAKYQRVLWGDGIDPTAFGRGTDADWVGLVMYLCGGAAKTADSDREKKLHRITAAAAALCNWHKMVLEGKVPM